MSDHRLSIFEVIESHKKDKRIAELEARVAKYAWAVHIADWRRNLTVERCFDPEARRCEECYSGGRCDIQRAEQYLVGSRKSRTFSCNRWVERGLS